MRIYNKNRFVLGLFWCYATLMLLFNVWERSALKLAVSAFLAVKCLYSALSESGNAEQRRQEKYYATVATQLYGKHHALRTNLPLVLLVPVYAVALVLRFGFEIWLPAWFFVVHLLAVTAAAFYSIGIERSIEAYISANFPLDDTEANEEPSAKPWDPER